MYTVLLFKAVFTSFSKTFCPMSGYTVASSALPVRKTARTAW